MPICVRWAKERRNFAQRLAEDTGFPDGHFDIVASYILHHELPLHVSQQVMKEAYRISRPGGVFYPVDFTGLLNPPPSISRAKWVSPGWRRPQGGGAGYRPVAEPEFRLGQSSRN